MAVIAAECCAIEDLLGQQQAIGNDDGDISPKFAKSPAILRIPKLTGVSTAAPEARLPDVPAISADRAHGDRPALAAGYEPHDPCPASTNERRVGTENSGVPMNMMLSDIRSSVGFCSAVFKRVYELEIKPLEVFCVARGKACATGQAGGGDHRVLGFHDMSLLYLLCAESPIPMRCTQ